MKKIQLVALILILCLAGTNNGSAQDDSGGSVTKFSYGGQIGSSFSGFSRFGQTFSLKRLGVTGGMFAQYSVLPFANVALEVNYAMAGATEVSPDLVYNYKPNETYLTQKWSTDVLLQAVQVPVIINLSPVSDGDIVPRIILGYSFEYYFRAFAKDQVYSYYPDGMLFNDRNFANVSSNFADWNQSVIGGFGLDFRNTRPKFSIEARYQVGLLDMSTIKGLHTINIENNFSINSLAVYLKFYL